MTDKDHGAALAAAGNDTGSSPTETASDDKECRHCGQLLHSEDECLEREFTPKSRATHSEWLPKEQQALMDEAQWQIVMKAISDSCKREK